MKKVLLTGSLAYDQILKWSGDFRKSLNFDFVSSSFFCPKMESAFGGTAGNIAYGLQLLGEIEVCLQSVVGELDSIEYLSRLSGWGVSTQDVQVIAKSKTAVAHICNDDHGQQITFFYPGPVEENVKYLAPKSSGFDLACISASYLSVMSGCMDFCIENKIAFIFDPGQQILEIVKSDMFMKYAQKSFLLVVNRSELQMALDSLDLSQSELFSACKSIIITDGGNPIELITNYGGKTEFVNVNEVEAVDVTGAGDAFRAGLIKNICDGLSLLESCNAASQFAKKCILSDGAQNYL